MCDFTPGSSWTVTFVPSGPGQNLCDNTHKVIPAQYIGRRRKTLIRIDELPIPLKLPLLQQYMMQMKVIEAGVIMQGNPKQD